MAGARKRNAAKKKKEELVQTEKAEIASMVEEEASLKEKDGNTAKVKDEIITEGKDEITTEVQSKANANTTKLQDEVISEGKNETTTENNEYLKASEREEDVDEVEEKEESHDEEYKLTEKHNFNKPGKEISGSGLSISLRLDIYQNLIYVQDFISNIRIVDIPFLIFRIPVFIVGLLRSILKLKGNPNHKYKSLTPTAWKCIVVMCVLSFGTRLYKVDQPNWICWDEAHFGKFLTHYLNGTFYIDVHPPLGKMMHALAGYMTGYNGTNDESGQGNFAFHDPGNVYTHSYVGMRVMCASIGALCVPLAFLIVWELSQSLPASVIGASFILFDNGCTTISRYILLDPIMLFFINLSIYCTLKSHSWKDCPFSRGWWLWMFATGLSLGCTFSVKWVGLFVILFVGLNIAHDLWQLLDDRSLFLLDFAKHLATRVVCLIIVPIIIYIICFYFHLKHLPNTGPGDYAFSSRFQTTLKGNHLHGAKVPRDLAYGADITLRSYGPDGGLLHSHNDLYPEELGGQQQVTAYIFEDPQNHFKVHKARELTVDDDTLEPVKDGDLIRLMHVSSRRNLHGHVVKAAVTPHVWQVSCYGNNGTGDDNDLWRVKILSGSGPGGVVLTVRTAFQLVHEVTKCAIFNTKNKLPDWGFHQHEIACQPQPTDDPYLGWNIEGNIHKQVPVVAMADMAPSFWQKMYEYNLVMWTTNSALIPHEGEDTSQPWEWPVVYRGNSMSVEEVARIYCLGNPILWWGMLGVFALYVAYIFFFEIRNRRGYEIDNELFEKSKSVIRACAWLMGLWAIHYLPFWTMTRVLYYHHYFPSYMFGSMMSGIILEHVTQVMSVSLPSKFQRKFYYSGIASLVALCPVSFYLFRDLTYGMSGPHGGQSGQTFAGYKWLESWEL